MSNARWRNILVNWINCYNEGTDWPLHQGRSLQSILEQLHSGSLVCPSPVEAPTLDGFIGDKYPEFKFENGTSCPTTDSDMCMAASLLLLYVCVRTEHADMRSAMCTGLSREDQEVILKFTKCLMNRSPVAYEDVHTAIIECCGEVLPSLGAGAADTPPPLRALHGEVRRLRAALDSERFDRSYLQDELTATNGRLDKLLAEKEQCQREVTSLRAQLSAGREAAAEEREGAAEGAGDAARAHARQLAALEERLADAHAQYEDCERARLRCKSKLDEIRSERDRLAEWARAEGERALALSAQLEGERAAADALRDALAELRAYRRAAQRDDSLLECDDAGTPTDRSFAHDSSACGDVCAAVVEVQLCEERARVARLALQLQASADKVKELEKALVSKEEEIQAKVKFTNELCTTFDKQKSNMQCKLDENHTEIQRITIELHALKIGKDTLENQIKDYKNIIDSNQSLISGLKKENEEFKAITAELAQSSLNDIEKLKREKEMITIQFMQFKIKAEECENILTTDLEELKAIKESMQSKVNELNNVNESNAIEKAQLEEKYKHLKQKSDQTIKVLTQDQSSTSKVLEEKVAQLAELQTQNMELQNQIELIARDYEQKLKIASLKSEESKTNYEKQINICKNIINANKVEIDALISEKKAMQKSADNISTDFHREIQELRAKHLFLENSSVEDGKIISCKENEIQQLQNEIAALNVKIEETKILNDNHIEDLRNKNEALENLLCECNDNIKSKQTKIEQLERENNNLVMKLEEITNLKNIEVKKMMKENNTFEIKIIQIKKENMSLQTKINELTVKHMLELGETQKEKEVLNTKITEMKAINESEEAEIMQLKSKITELEANVKEIKSLKANEVSELKNNENVFIQNISALEKTIEANQTHMAQLQNKIFELKAKIEDIIISKNIEVEKLKEGFVKKITTLENVMQSDQIKIKQIADEMSKSKNKLDEKKNDCEILVNSNQLCISHLQNEITRFKTEAEEEIKTLTFNLKQSKAEKVLLEESIKELEETVAVNQSENKEFQNKYDILQDELKKENSKMSEILETLRLQKEFSKNEIQGLQNIYDLSESKLIKLQDTHFQMKLSAEETVNNYAVKEMQIKDEKNELEKKILDYKNIIESVKSDVNKLEHENKQLKANTEEITKISLKLQTILDENQTLEQMNMASNATITTSQLKIAHLQTEFQQLKETSNDTIKMMTGEANKLNKIKISLETKLSEHENYIKLSDSEINQLEHEIQLMKNQNDETKHKMTLEIKELDTERKNLEQKVTELEDIISANQMQFVELQTNHMQLKSNTEKSVMEISRTLKSTTEQKENLEKKAIENQNLIVSYQSTIVDLEENLSQIKDHCEELKKMLSFKIEDLQEQTRDKEKMLIEFNTLKSEKECLESKTKICNENIISNNFEIKKKALENVALKNKLQENIKQLEINSKKLDATKDFFEKTSCDLKNNMQAKQIYIEELLNSKESLETETVQFKNTIESMETKIFSMETESVNLREELKQTSKLYEDLKKYNKILICEHEKSIKSANDDLVSALNTNTEIEKSLCEKNDEISKLVKKYIVLEKGLVETESKVKFMKENISFLVKSTEDAFIDDELILKEDDLLAALSVFISNMKETNENMITQKAVLESDILELKNKLQLAGKDISSNKMKIRTLIMQSLADHESIKRETDLFDNELAFVNVTKDLCSLPNDNETTEHYIAVLSKIVTTYKEISKMFKTGYISLKESEKLILKEKENISCKLNVLKSEFEITVGSLNDQLQDKKALIGHLEKGNALIMEDKNAIIDKLNSQLILEKNENLKLLDTQKALTDDLSTTLEESNKSKNELISTLKEEYNIKEIETRREFADKINDLQKECSRKESIIKKIVKSINTCKYNIVNIREKLHLSIPMNSFVWNSADGVSQTAQVNEIIPFPDSSGLANENNEILRSLCDEEKMKNISLDDSVFLSLEADVQKISEITTLFAQGLKNMNNVFKDKLQSNDVLNSELLAKNNLVQCLEEELGNIELKYEDVNIKYTKLKEQVVMLTDLLKSREAQLKTTEIKATEIELVNVKKEEGFKQALKDLNNNLVEVTTERDSIVEKNRAIAESARFFLKELNNLVEIINTFDSFCIDHALQSIEKLESEFLISVFAYESDVKPTIHIQLRNLYLAITELKERNNVFYEKCNAMELEKDSQIKMLASEVTALSKSIAQREDMVNDVKVSKEKDMADLQKQVNLLSSDLIETSEERNVTISNLEKIVYDKNRIITTLQSEIIYLKSLVAESENKLLDVNKELNQCRENCQELSIQLKLCVGQKNEEINNLKKTLSKLSTTESKACQIIKVSAKYQAIILKRIAEIKSSTALRELTQFSNVEDKRKSLASGAVTMDELESFLENNERQMRKLMEKQSCLQKERDHYAEISKINEDEAFSVKKYLTELLAHFKTFSSVKEVYNQKLSQVISLQRIIRREIHSLDQNISESVMSKLERSYGVVMQDLVETALNISRWAERCIDRSISPEKLKQAFASNVPPLSSSQLQNTGLEVQIDELLTAFKKVQEQVQTAKSSGGMHGGGEACSVMEVRAEYEDKLNRMKAKMKQLYQEQMSAYQARQDAELSRLQRKLEEKTKGYEEHIRDLTKELWSVGEKFLMKKEEAEWLRRRPSSSSLMSLQHVHSSGLGPPPAREGRESGRAADTQSLHRVSAHKPTKSEGRGFHMSDEEGEVFDNRWLRELETPTRPSGARRQGDGAGRISELKYRNSLCPPHLKSSYPAETHFAPLPCNEDEIKFEGVGGGGGGGAGGAGERRNRKEVGITAYKKPGPPTPSKNAGRLSATDSELRESLRPEHESAAQQRKTSTPSRIRALFRSNRSDAESTGTPRSKRLSIFRKKQ